MRIDRLFVALMILWSYDLFGQVGGVYAIVDADPCRTCEVGSFCQPNPMAGSEGYTDLGYTIEQIWGPKQIININGRNYNIFNADAAQTQIIRDVIEIFPTEFAEALPDNFRVGNPRRPYSHISTATSTIGGSKKCTPYSPDNLRYESIVLGSHIFTDLRHGKYLTIIHECGHFISRHFDMPSFFTPEQTSLSQNYFTEVYHGETRSHEETCAQMIIGFFYQMYFERNTKRTIPLNFDEIIARPLKNYLPWMNDFIKDFVSDHTSAF
jgi:hypothetical protein